MPGNILRDRKHECRGVHLHLSTSHRDYIMGQFVQRTGGCSPSNFQVTSQQPFLKLFAAASTEWLVPGTPSIDQSDAATSPRVSRLAWDRFSFRASGSTTSADTLILDFWLPELGKIRLLLFAAILFVVICFSSPKKLTLWKTKGPRRGGGERL